MHKQKVTNTGSIIGHKIDYKLHILREHWPKYPAPLARQPMVPKELCPERHKLL